MSRQTNVFKDRLDKRIYAFMEQNNITLRPASTVAIIQIQMRLFTHNRKSAAAGTINPFSDSVHIHHADRIKDPNTMVWHEIQHIFQVRKKKEKFPKGLKWMGCVEFYGSYVWCFVKSLFSGNKRNVFREAYLNMSYEKEATANETKWHELEEVK